MLIKLILLMIAPLYILKFKAQIRVICHHDYVKLVILNTISQTKRQFFWLWWFQWFELMSIAVRLLFVCLSKKERRQASVTALSHYRRGFINLKP
jgi:hypothetical protein